MCSAKRARAGGANWRRATVVVIRLGRGHLSTVFFLLIFEKSATPVFGYFSLFEHESRPAEQTGEMWKEVSLVFHGNEVEVRVVI